MGRRRFFRQLAGVGVATLSAPDDWVLGSAEAAAAARPLGVHPFIEAHPEAVFIRRTNVAAKTDTEAIRREARALAHEILRLHKGRGRPTQTVAVKPNLTSTKKTGLTHAIITDPYAVEGFVDRFRELGVPASSIYVREGLAKEQQTTGYPELAQRAGLHYGDDEARTPTTKECPDGVVFRRTRYLGPFAYPDAFVLNVAKLKTHAMGLTLCVKNLQGTNVPPWIRFCGGVNPAIGEDFQKDAEAHVDELYDKHLRAGLPRWDAAKGRYMEMWAQRTLDHYPLIAPSVGLHVVEGVYSQNGDAFDGGPGPSGLPDVFLTNVLLFGRDPFRVDIVGHWLGGHEPGNFGLFHLAKERGLSTALDPMNIPVYEWTKHGPRLVPLDRFARMPLLTPYLPKPDEDKYHMVNEPFAYAPEPVPGRAVGWQARRACARWAPTRGTTGRRWPSSTRCRRRASPRWRSSTSAACAAASWPRDACPAACTAPAGARARCRRATTGSASG